MGYSVFIAMASRLNLPCTPFAIHGARGVRVVNEWQVTKAKCLASISLRANYPAVDEVRQ